MHDRTEKDGARPIDQKRRAVADVLDSSPEFRRVAIDIIDRTWDRIGLTGRNTAEGGIRRTA